MPRPAHPHRVVRTCVLLVTTFGVAALGSPAASAMGSPAATDAPVPPPLSTHRLDNSPASYLGTPDQPVTIGVGALHLFVGEEPGNELGVPVDLSGATIQVTLSAPATAAADDETHVCTTDADGACTFVDDGGPYTIEPLPGDVVVIEQLTAPTSGLFTLPSVEDRVVHAVAAVDTTTPGGGTLGDAPWDQVGRADPLPTVDRVAPDVLGKRDDWTQIVLFAPLATAVDPTPTENAPGAPAPDAPVGSATGTATTTTTTAGVDAPASASTAAGTSAAPAASTPPTSAAATSTGAAGTVATGDLATTGTEVVPALGLGGLLLLAGGGALLAARRRRA